MKCQVSLTTFNSQNNRLNSGGVGISTGHNNTVFGDMLHSVLVDESYSAIANHIYEQTRKKIVNNEYVEFSKLIPKNKYRRLEEESSGLHQIVIKGGYMFCLPPGEQKDNLGSELISNFGKWDQAFRIFTHIYTGAYPTRAAELMQYSHTIHDASLSFPWENVYAYDRDFRHHLSLNVGCSWGVILNQAWTFYMRDRSVYSMHGAGGSGGSAHRGNGNRPKKDVCWAYQNGKCTYGISCKWDHKCGICGKYGHGAYTCRKLTGAGRPSNNDRSREQHQQNHSQQQRKGNDRYHYFKDDVRPKTEGNANNSNANSNSAPTNQKK